MQYDTKQEGNEIFIKNTSIDNILYVDLSNKPFKLEHVKDPLEVHFQIPSPEGDFDLITGRDIDDYLKNSTLPFDSSLQYIEIGAGLGELIPYLVRKFGNSLAKKPIVIDPANYNEMKNTLIYAKQLQLGQRYDKIFQEFIDRCDIIMDHNKVLLFNMVLGKAINRFPELIQKGDVVIDLCGASLYPSSEKSNIDDENVSSRIRMYEKRLTKPKGKLLIYH